MRSDAFGSATVSFLASKIVLPPDSALMTRPYLVSSQTFILSEPVLSSTLVLNPFTISVPICWGFRLLTSLINLADSSNGSPQPSLNVPVVQLGDAEKG